MKGPRKPEIRSLSDPELDDFYMEKLPIFTFFIHIFQIDDYGASCKMFLIGNYTHLFFRQAQEVRREKQHHTVTSKFDRAPKIENSQNGLHIYFKKYCNAVWLLITYVCFIVLGGKYWRHCSMTCNRNCLSSSSRVNARLSSVINLTALSAGSFWMNVGRFVCQQNNRLSLSTQRSTFSNESTIDVCEITTRNVFDTTASNTGIHTGPA